MAHSDDSPPISEADLYRAFTEHRSDPDRVASLIDRALAHPDAEETYIRAELLAELADIYSEAGRVDEAIAVHERALAAGLGAVPDPRMDQARYLARAGRAEPMRKIHQAVLEADPEDVWFYNAAGTDEADVGDHERAARWFATGIELCLDSGDPEDLVGQLLELRNKSLKALGRSADEVQERGDGFLRERQKEDADARDRSGPEDLTPVEVQDDSDGKPVTAIGWFPRDEFPAALERWPALEERFGGGSYQDYARFIQLRAVQFWEASGIRPRLSPLRIDALSEYAADLGLDPGDASTRSRWCAELARRGESSPWPPGRNDPCWCGSGTKYKRCCGTVST